MKRSLFSGFRAAISVSTVIIFLTAGKCNSGSGNSSNNGGNKTRDYTFESVALSYSLSNDFDRTGDLGDLYAAHGVDPTKTQGVITSLAEILRYEDNYSEERKPSIEFTINPVGEESKSWPCHNGDVGDNYIKDVPDYGPRIGTATIEIKSVVTYHLKKQLRWTKTFYVNEQWWDDIDNGLCVEGLILDAYVKSYCPSGSGWVGPQEEEEHTGPQDEPEDDGEDWDCEIIELGDDVDINEDEEGVEIEVIEEEEYSAITPTLDRPIYINGDYSNTAEWNSPKTVKIVKNN